tara:strand:+ start:411 stop:1034 length:624 start_codon:yes stop_codon:yes gene_type:complete
MSQIPLEIREALRKCLMEFCTYALAEYGERLREANKERGPGADDTLSALPPRLGLLTLKKNGSMEIGDILFTSDLGSTGSEHWAALLHVAAARRGAHATFIVSESYLRTVVGEEFEQVKKQRNRGVDLKDIEGIEADTIEVLMVHLNGFGMRFCAHTPITGDGDTLTFLDDGTLQEGSWVESRFNDLGGTDGESHRVKAEEMPAPDA